jgi:hypothetical protein
LLSSFVLRVLPSRFRKYRENWLYGQLLKVCPNGEVFKYVINYVINFWLEKGGKGV